jgi:hypothetical protein
VLRVIATDSRDNNADFPAGIPVHFVAGYLSAGRIQAADALVRTLDPIG